MDNQDDEAERTGRPVQATPDFFVQTVAEHEDRGEIEAGTCSLQLDDGGRRRFVVGTDVNEIDETEYLVDAIDDLIEMLESTDVGPDSFELRVSVDDVDRVVEQAREEETVTLQFEEEGLSGLLATCLAEVAADEE